VPLDPEMVADCFYAPEAQLVDELLELDIPGSKVVCRMPTSADLPLTRDQRVHPTRHPRHINGALMIHATGMVGFVHAYYVFGLRHADGWTGYGARIHHARFHSIAPPGEPLILTGWTTQVRKSPKRVVARYSFEFKQGDTLVYEGDQTAVWEKMP
jgi:hypothetical protein